MSKRVWRFIDNRWDFLLFKTVADLGLTYLTKYAAAVYWQLVRLSCALAECLSLLYCSSFFISSTSSSSVFIFLYTFCDYVFFVHFMIDCYRPQSTQYSHPLMHYKWEDTTKGQILLLTRHQLPLLCIFVQICVCVCVWEVIVYIFTMQPQALRLVNGPIQCFQFTVDSSSWRHLVDKYYMKCTKFFTVFPPWPDEILHCSSGLITASFVRPERIYFWLSPPFLY